MSVVSSFHITRIARNALQLKALNEREVIIKTHRGAAANGEGVAPLLLLRVVHRHLLEQRQRRGRANDKNC